MAGTEENKLFKFHKDTFEKTTQERRQKVIEVAVSEFAAKGYNATNINDIAKKSGISIGAMYSYFASKEDLFLAVVNRAYMLLEGFINEAKEKHTGFFDLLSGMLKASREYAVQYPDLNRIYLDLTTQALSQMAERFADKLETITVRLYKDVIREAKTRGEVDAHIDEEVTAFFIDNLFMMYQFSFSVDYFKDRMKIFLGDGKVSDIESTEGKIMDMIRRALS